MNGMQTPMTDEELERDYAEFGRALQECSVSAEELAEGLFRIGQAALKMEDLLVESRVAYTATSA